MSPLFAPPDDFIQHGKHIGILFFQFPQVGAYDFAHIAERCQLIDISTDSFLLFQYISSIAYDDDWLIHCRCRYKLGEVHICFFSFSFDYRVIALSKTHGDHFCFVVGFSFVLSFCGSHRCKIMGFGVRPDKLFVRRRLVGRRLYKQYACLSLRDRISIQSYLSSTPFN